MSRSNERRFLGFSASAVHNFAVAVIAGAFAPIDFNAVFPISTTFHRFSAFPYAILMQFAISRFNLTLIP
jgi:hypothetical protein